MIDCTKVLGWTMTVRFEATNKSQRSRGEFGCDDCGQCSVYVNCAPQLSRVVKWATLIQYMLMRILYNIHIRDCDSEPST